MLAAGRTATAPAATASIHDDLSSRTRPAPASISTLDGRLHGSRRPWEPENAPRLTSRPCTRPSPLLPSKSKSPARADTSTWPPRRSTSTSVVAASLHVTSPPPDCVSGAQRVSNSHARARKGPGLPAPFYRQLRTCTRMTPGESTFRNSTAPPAVRMDVEPSTLPTRHAPPWHSRSAPLGAWSVPMLRAPPLHSRCKASSAYKYLTDAGPWLDSWRRLPITRCNAAVGRALRVRLWWQDATVGSASRGCRRCTALTELPCAHVDLCRHQRPARPAPRRDPRKRALHFAHVHMARHAPDLHACLLHRLDLHVAIPALHVHVAVTRRNAQHRLRSLHVQQLHAVASLGALIMLNHSCGA